MSADVKEDNQPYDEINITPMLDLAYVEDSKADVDMNVVKNVPLKVLGEHGMFQFRAEFFNLLNRVNLGQPVGDTSNSLFGKSTSAYGARNEQFGVKIIF